MFTIKQYLPIIGTETRYTELLNKHMLIINKYIANSDDQGLADYFEQLIEELLIDKTLYLKLYNVDKFLILINLRSICIGNEIKFKHSTNGINISLYLHTILNKYNYQLSDFTQHMRVNDTYSVQFNVPKTLYVGGIDDIMTQVIDKVIEKDNTYELFTNTEKNKLLNILPANKIKNIIEYINKMSQKGEQYYIFNAIGKIKLESVTMNPYNNNMFYFIKNIFSEKLSDIYQLQYSMVNTLGFSSNSVDNNTPAENYMYITMYEENNKQQNSNAGVS